MEKTKSDKLVVKSNRLTEARYEFNIWETRVFTKMVTMINKDDSEFKKYKINIGELIEFFGGKAHNDYDRIKEVPESLMKKIISMPYTAEDGEERLFITPLIVGATTSKNKQNQKQTSYIELAFHPDLKEHLLDLKEKFLQYDIRHVMSISSAHSVRFYELLKQYEKIGHRTFDVVDLKSILGVPDKYPLYANFKQRILTQAQKDVKKFTDIEFSIEEIKKGRRIHAIKFWIYKNSSVPTKSQSKKSKFAKGVQLSLSTSEPISSDVIQALVGLGVSYDKALYLVKEYGEEVVRQELSHAQKELRVTPNVKNPAGLVISMIEQQNYTKSQAVKQSKKKDQLKKKKKKKYEEYQIEKLRLEYVEKRNTAVNKFLRGRTKKEIEALINSGASSFTKKAIKKAVESGNKQEEHYLKYSVVARQLKEEALHDFDQYLAVVYQSKIIRDGIGESLKRV